MSIPSDVRRDVIGRLKADYKFRKSGDWFRQGVCPSCGKKELFCHSKEPWTVKCGRENKCGWTSDIREMYPDAFENFNERYPPTQEKPNATAEAYMDFCRRLPVARTKGWYRQGKYFNSRATGAKGTATVLFDIDRANGLSMERFVETIFIRDQDGNVKPQKAHFTGKFRGRWWLPPGVDLSGIEELWLVEGCIDAMSLTLSGIPAAACLSSTNYPGLELKKLSKSVKLVWALDNDQAGRKYIRRHAARAVEDEFSCDAAVIPTKGRNKIDWNDAFQRGWLEDAQKVNSYRYHGALLLAKTALDKALLTWYRYGRNDFGVEFQKKIYWFAIDFEKFSKELNSLRDSDPDPREESLRLKAAKLSGALHEIANCRFEFLYFLTSRLTDESWYYAKVEFPKGGHSIKNTFTGTMVASASEFKKRLLSIAPGALFSGNTHQLNWIIRNYLDDIKIVETVDFIGYSREHATYVFNDVAISKGHDYQLNDEDFFEIGTLSLKSLNQSLRLHVGEQASYDKTWINHLWEAFGVEGLIALTFFFGSLFAEQIRARQKSFPFIEIVGNAGSGKTTLLEFLWKLAGRADYEGFDPNKATFAARARIFTQTANLPVALIESDREDSAKQRQFDWDELKTAYNGRASSARGVKNSGNDTDEPPFRGSILISQNDMVNSSEAIMSRIIHTQFDTSGHTPGGKAAADHLSTIPVENVSYFLRLACRNEEKILATVFNKFAEYERILRSNPDVKHTRIIKTHAQMMALADALTPIVNLSKDQVKRIRDELMIAAIERQRAIADDHPIVQAFWEAFDYMNEDGTLDHSKSRERIAVNLNHFQKIAHLHHQRIPDVADLKKYLKQSKTRKFVATKAVASRHANTDQADVFTTAKTVKCWVFERETSNGQGANT